MSLHNSKRTAILQLCNSVSPLDLENIQQLADGTYFCSVISSVFKQSPELQPVKSPSALKVISTIDNDSTGDIKVLATDFKVDQGALNDKSSAVVENKKASENCKSEIRSSKRRSCKKDSLSNLSSEISISTEIPNSVLEIAELHPVQSASALKIESTVDKNSTDDIQVLATDFKVDQETLNDKNIAVVESKNASENSKSEIRSSKRRSCRKDSLSNLSPEISKSISNSAPEIQYPIPETLSSAPEFSDDITKRYSFIKKFIDDTYIIESEKLIMYSLCVKSDELELAKVAVLILSSVVKNYLSSKSNVLNTLALLDYEVQEDIKECISLFLLQDKKVTKEEIEYVLTKPAQYKRSPRSSRLTTTPQRSCMSRYKKYSFAVSSPAEELISDSPLKTLFESPHFQNRELLTKELTKTRNMLHAEEQRSEDLTFEVNSLKKKLGDLAKENKIFKENIKKLRSEEEINQCKNCEIIQSKHDKAIATIKAYKLQERENEKELSEKTALISMLEEKVKEFEEFPKRRKSNCRFQSALEEKDFLIQHLQNEMNVLADKNRNLQNEINANNSFLREKTAEVACSTEPLTPDVGECLGSVIEAEYKQLQLKYRKLEFLLDNLLNQKCVNTVGVELINRGLNISTISQCDVSLPVPMDESEISEGEKNTNLDIDGETKVLKSESRLLNYNLNDAEIVLKDAPIILNDSILKDADVFNKVILTDSNFNNIEAVNKDSLNMLKDSCLNDVEVVNNDTPSILNESYVAKIHFKDASRVLKDYSLRNNIEINSKAEPSLSNNDNLKITSGLVINNTPSLLNNCDILTNMPDVDEKGQICANSLRETKSGDTFQGETVPVVNTGIGSLWSQYNDSGSECESSFGVSFSNNANGLSRQDLLRQLGFSEAEYSTKLGIAKKLWVLFKELFTTNGSNGFVGLSLKSDEDYIMCLLPIREYLFRFQNNSLSKDHVLPDKSLCNCDSMSYVKVLKRENTELKIKLAESESYVTSLTELKEAEMKDLLNRLDSTEQKCQELIKTNEDFKNKNKLLFQKCETLKNRLTKMMSKISEADELKNQYTNLLNAKSEAEQLFKRRLKICRDKIISFGVQKKELQAAIEKEKKLKRDMISHIEGLKSEIITLMGDKKCLEKGVKEMRSENMKLNSCIEAMKSREANAVKNNVVSCSIPIHHNSGSQYDKNSEININVKVNDGNSYKTASVHDMSVASSNYPSKFMSLDASQISSSFNKSLHSFALITDDEEEYSFQGSIADIKKEYDSTALTGNERRITELHLRNSKYLPHMQSCYPVELQSMSPFSQKLLEFTEKSKEYKLTERNTLANCVTSQALKKRKAKEIESECEAGPSHLLKTPVKDHKHFKTPSSLQKLLRYRRKNRQPIPKPKS